MNSHNPQYGIRNSLTSLVRLAGDPDVRFCQVGEEYWRLGPRPSGPGFHDGFDEQQRHLLLFIGETRIFSRWGGTRRVNVYAVIDDGSLDGMSFRLGDTGEADPHYFATTLECGDVTGATLPNGTRVVKGTLNGPWRTYR